LLWDFGSFSAFHKGLNDSAEELETILQTIVEKDYGKMLEIARSDARRAFSYSDIARRAFAPSK